jgi:hypothetical protein
LLDSLLFFSNAFAWKTSCMLVYNMQAAAEELTTTKNLMLTAFGMNGIMLNANKSSQY